MQKLESINRIANNRKLSIATAAIIIILVVLDLFTTRQILYLNNASQIVLFILTAGIGYGVGSWILLGFTKYITKDLRAKSQLIRVMHIAVTLIQFSLLGILLYILYNNLTHCYEYFSLCNGTEFLTASFNATASITATVIMGILGFKFFSWYRSNKRNFVLLLYGLAAAALAISIAGDAFDKLLLAHIVQEKSTPGVIPQSAFIYQTFEKYHGEIEYKVVNPQTTTLYVVPSTLLDLYNQIIYWTSLSPYILTWAGTALLLHYYYKRTGKVDLKFWIIIAIPLVLYLIGSGLIFSLPSDIPYRFYFRLVFRAGTIGSSVLFGLAFYIITRNLGYGKVKDYLTIAAIGIATIGIANEVSALQQTYGVAAHSLVLLSSYLFTIGLYSSAISISQDNSLRKSIRKSAIEVSKLVEVLGAPKIEQEIERRVLTTVNEQQQVLREQTGVDSSLTEIDMKQYLGTVLKEIKILKNIEEILMKGKDILYSSYQFLVCSRFGGIRLFYNNYFDAYQKVMERYRRGEHKGIKLVTNIDKSSIDVIKKFLSIGVQIRHTKNMPPIDFAVSDKEMIATVEKMSSEEKGQGRGEGREEEQEMIRSLLVSNEQTYIHQFEFIFEELWNNGIDAKDRIAAIEQDLEPEFLEVITDHKKASQILVDLAKSAKKEVLFLLPIDRAMVRMDRLGVIDYLMQASQKNGVQIKIICPLSSENEEIVKRISSNSPNIRILNGNNSAHGMIIVDGERVLRAELREPLETEFSNAIGFTIYSNSKPSVDSFKSTFELLWNERTLNEELKRADRMQREFINIAAHELRNPIQPILSITEVLQHGAKDAQERELLDITVRNAKRLRQLTEDILDVSKIESNSLQLKREQFNLSEMVLNCISDFRNQIKNDNRDSILRLEALFSSNRDTQKKEKQDIFIEADRNRIYQVISNLLNNAIKFTKEGAIQVSIERKEEEKEKKKKTREDENDDVDDSASVVVICVKDTGVGIDSEIMPRLFSKFATSSESGGTGLGLFISKSIVEAHGGKIWAENNSYGKGSGFYFSLPLNTR